jgi:hypothetical protein
MYQALKKFLYYFWRALNKITYGESVLLDEQDNKITVIEIFILPLEENRCV